MTEKIVGIFVGIFSFLGTTLIGKYLTIFIISLFPILELRGGLIAASLLDVPAINAFIICVIGNILPIPFILWLITKIFEWLKKFNFMGKVVRWCEEKANNKKDQIEKLKYLGLYLFVAVPLPGTGAWMGALIAALLNMDKKKSLLTILLGVLSAGVIMLIVSYGIIGGLVN
ncbi:MAG: small multi-drug export protein [Bacilli bacterium]|nr:small multi-drug export protein [Bacilli bacterium]